MKGCRPLSDDEVRAAVGAFAGRYAKRDRALFVLGVSCGFRISELLSIRVGDVEKRGAVVGAVYVERRNTKGKRSGRGQWLNEDARAAVREWLDDLRASGGMIAGGDTFLFRSRVGVNRAISRARAFTILVDAFNRAGIDAGEGKLATHSMRKTFAVDMYRRLGGSVVNTAAALGHQQITSTTAYLPIDDDKIRAAVQENNRGLIRDTKRE